jgi:hypothetical protein
MSLMDFDSAMSNEVKITLGILAIRFLCFFQEKLLRRLA